MEVGLKLEQNESVPKGGMQSLQSSGKPGTERKIHRALWKEGKGLGGHAVNLVSPYPGGHRWPPT